MSAVFASGRDFQHRPEPAGPAVHNPESDMNFMNREQALMLFRTFLQMAGTFAIARGWLDADAVAGLTEQVMAIVGALMLAATIWWGYRARSNKNLVVAAAALPEVKKVLAEPEIAKAVPSAKVTSSY